MYQKIFDHTFYSFSCVIVKDTWGLEEQLHSFLTLIVDEGEGRIQASAAWLPWQKHGWVCFRAFMGIMDKRKSFQAFVDTVMNIRFPCKKENEKEICLAERLLIPKRGRNV